MNREIKEILVKYLKDFRLFSSKLLKIRDKKGRVVPFVLNKAQEKLHGLVEKSMNDNKPLRFIILKARQEGISTYVEGLLFRRNSFASNRNALVVAHDKDASTNLFNMYKRYYNELHPFLQPQIEHNNEKKLSFRKLKSEIKVTTAEARDKAGRSSTVQDLHASEVAFWSAAKDTMLAILQIIPDEPNTAVFIESTANGVGGWFYDTWQDAVNGENDYVPVFLAWFDLPEYSKEFEEDEEREELIKTLTAYEKSLQKAYNLTLEQLNWRRYTLRNKCNNDLDQFKQEYPSTPEEAFITSGRPVFDTQICFDNKEKAQNPVDIGDLQYTYDENGFINGAEWVKNDKGYIKLYQEIEVLDKEHYVFIAGCDVAEGLEQGDYSTIRVLDRRNYNVCMEWHGHIDPDKLADEQHKIQLFLKDKVYFGTEMNNHGLTTISKGFHLGVNQYYRENFIKGYTKSAASELGFKTDAKTKPYIIDNLGTWIRESLFTDNSKEFWGECLTFVKNEKGQMQAQGKDKDFATKCFDDRVMATAIMLIVHNWLPSYYVDKDKEPVARPFYEEIENELTETSF